MMKKFTFLALGLLMAIGAKAATELYAAISGTTMTIYYDNQRTSRSGKVAPTGEATGWLTFGNLASVTTVDFDASLKNATIASTAYWFDGMKALTTFSHTSNLETRSVTNMERMFRNCEKMTTWQFNSMYFVVSNVVNMHGMFNNCKKLEELDWSSYGARLQECDAMFLNCYALKTVKFSPHFYVDEVEDLSQMFSNCKALTSLDLSMFEVENVANFNKMFYNCAKLKTIYADYDWKAGSFPSATSDDMFNGCEVLKGEYGTTYSDTNPFDLSYAHPDMPDNKGYFTKSACPKPRDLQVDKKTATAMEISWKTESKHMRFTVWYRSVGQEGYSTLDAATNHIKLSDLKPDTEYEIYVVAQCSVSLKSENSAVLVESTLEEGEGVQNVQWNTEKCSKLMRNGQLFILIGDKTYNVLGNPVK